MRLGRGVMVIVLSAVGSVFGEEGRPVPSAAPSTVEMGAPVSVRDEKPAPVNPYNGLQQREEVYEFSEKPKVSSVKGQGEEKKWIITFTSKANCDATVAILDRDGKIIRHLASGVLGKNAPYPFQQGALSQKIEWDGQNDQGKPAPAGCKVKVGLGLQAKFERNIAYDPYELGDKVLVSTATDGTVYVGTGVPKATWGRAFDKNGNYLRTFWPPPAAEVEKWLDQMLKPAGGGGLGAYLVTTKWGDKVIHTARYGPFSKGVKMDDVVERAASGAKPAEGALPAALAAKKPPRPLAIVAMGLGCQRLVVDSVREEIYCGGDTTIYRFDGKTGKFDESWFPKGEFRGFSDGCIGPDGLLYARVGIFGYGQWIVRVDHDGTPLPIGGDAVDLRECQQKKQFPAGAWGYGFSIPPAFGKKPVRGLWVGLTGHSNVHERGLYVSPRGTIVAAVEFMDASWAMKHGVPENAPLRGGEQVDGSYVAVWTNDGKLLTANACGNMSNGHGIAMDREGNIYAAVGGLVPAASFKKGGATELYGLVEPLIYEGGIGMLAKFQGLGDRYPLGSRYGKGEAAPAGGLPLSDGGALAGALWAYDSLNAQTTRECTCHNIRYDMDRFARHWIPANHIFSIVVLDANGNRIIPRLGRYGNVDDTEADVKAGRDGLRFSWIKAVGASDTALYVADSFNRRILKAALSFAAEEEAPLP